MQKLTTAPIDGAKHDQKLKIVISAWEYLSCITLVGTFECNIWWSFVSHARSLSLPVSEVLRLPRFFCCSLDVTMCWTRKFSNPAISRKYIFMCIKHYWLLWVLQSSHESLAIFLFLSSIFAPVINFFPLSNSISAPFMHVSLGSSKITKFLAFAGLSSSPSYVYEKRTFAALE